MYAAIICSNGTRDQYDWLEKQPFLRKILSNSDILAFMQLCVYLFIHSFIYSHLHLLQDFFLDSLNSRKCCVNDVAQNVGFQYH